MYWIFLVFAILFEVAGTTCMKLAEGFTKLLPSVGVGVFYALSLGMLTLALKRIDLSVAYAIWAGLGMATVAVIGFVFFREPVTALKIGSIVLIVLGVAGLNLSGAGH